MRYHAVDGRIGVSFRHLDLAYPKARIVAALERIGFSTVDADVGAIARGLLGRADYRRGARMRDAPAVVDCSSFVKWVFGQAGIWLPRRSIQQSLVGQIIPLGRIAPWDLVFSTGARNYYFDDPSAGVGHVGIVTDDGTLIHAGGNGVVESPLSTVVGRRFRGARRMIVDRTDFATLACPPYWEVETSDDIRWIFLQTL